MKQHVRIGVGWSRSIHAELPNRFQISVGITVSQKQGQTERPTDVTAVILNEARKLISQAWDGVTPIRQVGLGVSKLTHETGEQMSLFEDPKMEYYRKGTSGSAPARRSKPKDDALVFRYGSGEKALAEAKKAVRENPSLRFHSRKLEDGTDCFEIVKEGKVTERHCVT